MTWSDFKTNTEFILGDIDFILILFVVFSLNLFKCVDVVLACLMKFLWGLNWIDGGGIWWWFFIYSLISTKCCLSEILLDSAVVLTLLDYVIITGEA